MNKIIYPHTQLQVTLEVQGIFGMPDQWKTTDQVNPGLFTYSVRAFKFEIDKGKICPKQLTRREQREQQQKNKKGGKKDTKKDESQQQQLRRQEEEQERQREEQWNQKASEDVAYRDFEDPFRAPQLKFQDSSKSQSLFGKSLVIFEERVFKDQGEWVTVVKAPVSTEEELAKMRKAKPKTLGNINDLNPVVMRCWLDYSALNSAEKTSVVQRCPLTQVDKTADSPEPKLDNTYIKFTVTVSERLLKKDDGVVGQKLIADPPEGEVVSDKVKVVRQLRDELRLGIESLAMEYSAMFMKELNLYEDFKNMNYFLVKKNDITKRKEHFLYDFNVSGKYKILKDRIKKTIVHLCQKYFTEQTGSSKIFTGVSCTQRDQFYSQIYNFLVTKYKETLKQLIFEKKQNLKEVEVLSKASQEKRVHKYLKDQLPETILEKIERVIEEYQILGDFKYGANLFKTMLERDPSNTGIKYSYAIYCVKNKLKKAEQILPLVEDYLSYHKDDLKVRLKFLLLLIASENEDNCRKAWILIRELIEVNPDDSRNLILASFIFSELLKMQDLGEKYLALAERIELKKEEKIPKDGKHKEEPIESELPTVKSLPSYSQELSQEQKDSLWIEVLKLFLDLNLFNIVEKVQSKVQSNNNIIFDILNLNALKARGKEEQFENQAKELYAKSKSQQVLDLLVSHLLEHSNSETQKYLKISLVKTAGSKQLQILLQMAAYYLKNQQFANSRSCVLKYIEKKPKNSGLSWRILGICELNLGNLDEALDSLKKANIADINNSENWLWISRVFARKGNFVMCNQCINQYESMIGHRCETKVARQLVEVLSKGGCQQVFCEEKMRQQLLERLSQGL